VHHKIRKFIVNFIPHPQPWYVVLDVNAPFGSSRMSTTVNLHYI